MGAWHKDAKSHVAHMDEGDFYSSERSALIAAAGSVRIELTRSSAQFNSVYEQWCLTRRSGRW